MNSEPWRIHEKACHCASCEYVREHERALSENLTSELLPEMPESPTLSTRVKGAIGETLAWLALLGFVLLMVRCGQGPT